ncbi:MAG: hypothetical protein R3B09_03740 [Nannocystaceae bacterium]
MSTASPKHIELPPVVVPPHLWTRSERPPSGWVVQIAIPAFFLLAGAIAWRLDAGSSKYALLGIGVVLAVLIPAAIQHYLEGLSQRVLTANRATAAELRRTLRAKPLVKLFAPAAWLTLQEAQLALRLSDGRAAADLFAETSRLCKRPDAVMLVSAQAHALVVAGDRKAARELLNKLAAAKLLGPRDQLDLGIVMLLESHKRSRQAMAYIEAARKTIGDHPRVIAALALALQRAERVDEAAQHLEQAQISLQEDPDPVVEELVNRARRDMRRYIEAQLRRERRARSRRTTVVVTSEHAVSEIVSGEISSRGDSGAVPRAGEQTGDGITSVVADALADSERGDEVAPAAQPSVKVELRDPSLGEPIRLETKYALKGKEAPKEPQQGRRRRELGPAIDIDLDEGGDEDEEDDEAVARSERVTRPDVSTSETSRVEAKPKVEAPKIEAPKIEAPKIEAPKIEAPKVEAPKIEAPKIEAPKIEAPKIEATFSTPEERPNSGLLSVPAIDPSAPSGLLAAIAAGTSTQRAPERDEGSDLRRKLSLSETLAALNEPPPPSGRDDASKPEADAPEKPAEADAPMAMRRRKTVATEVTGSGLHRPPPLPLGALKIGAPAGERKMPTFAPPPGKSESGEAPPRPSFAPMRPKDSDKG